MNDAPEDVSADQHRPEADGSGWYLYGITERLPGENDVGGISQLEGIEGQPVSLVIVDQLAAIVTPVSVENFSLESLSTRAGDAAWLEAMVRSHNDVIVAVHAQRTILPAKFGSVYARLEDVRRTLEPSEEELRAQLAHLRGTDEWAVHIYADRAAVEADVAAHDPRLIALREQLADARPGRAFFLQRKLTDELAAATDAALNEAARRAHSRLAARTMDFEASPTAPGVHGASGRIEILRAAYLVGRDDADAFMAEVDALDQVGADLSVEVTGPWPPYSFVNSVEGKDQ